ncbi:hypothetical protein D3C86_2243660 [compost metagenome]
MLRISKHLLHILLEFLSRDENTMLTTDTFDPDIHPHPNNLHFIGSARMRFLHLYDIP